MASPVNSSKIDRAAWALALLFGLAVSYLAVLRYLNFTLFIGDHATICQMIWSNLHGKLAQTTTGSHFFSTAESVSFMTFHFTPIYFLLTPLFFIIPIQIGFIALKCVLIAAAGLVYYYLSKEALGAVKALCLALIFWSSPQMMSCLHDSFHGDYFAPLFFFLSFWFYKKNNFFPFLIAAVLFLSSKESFWTTTFMLGLYALIVDRKSLRWPLSLIGISLGWGLTYLFFLKPFFYLNNPPLPGNDWAALTLKNLSLQTAASLFLNPQALFNDLWFFVQNLKIFTFLHPLFLLWLPEMAIHKLLGQSYEGHYGILIASLVFLSLPYALKFFENFLSKYFRKQTNAIFLVLFLLALSGSYDSLKILNPKNFTPNPHKAAQKEALSLIPKDASVSCADLYLTFLSSREKLDWLGHEEYKRKYEYVLLDLNRENNEHIEWPIIQNYWLKTVDSGDYNLLFDKDNIRLYRYAAYSKTS